MIGGESNRAGWLLAVSALATAIAAVDWAVGGATVVTSLLVAPPLFASLRLEPRVTAAVGGYSLALAIVIGIPNEIFGTLNHLVRLLVVATGAAAGLWMAWLRSRVRSAGDRASILAEAATLLDASLEMEGTIERIAALPVPALADATGVDLLGEDGTIRRAFTAARDSESEAVANKLTDRYPIDAGSDHPVARVIRTGRTERLPRIHEARQSELAESARQLRMLRALGPDSGLIVPLAAHGRTYGALTLASFTPRRIYRRDEIEVAEELALSAALAIDNAHLHEREARIATVLQRSLVPGELPEVPWVEAAARFLPLGEGTEMGGDFYDMFHGGGARWMAVIGDVCGKGPEAAALTSLIRYTLRATRLREHTPPSEALTVLNRTLLDRPADGRFCTVSYASMEPADGGVRLRVSSGGHPPPMLLRSGGGIEQAGEPGTLLGVVEDVTLNDYVAELVPGDVIVLFTDGLLEARTPGNPPLGEQGIRELLRSVSGEDPSTIVERLEREALDIQEGYVHDDIAILAIRVVGELRL